jgi:hypothetical protein
MKYAYLVRLIAESPLPSNEDIKALIEKYGKDTDVQESDYESEIRKFRTNQLTDLYC